MVISESSDDLFHCWMLCTDCTGVAHKEKEKEPKAGVGWVSCKMTFSLQKTLMFSDLYMLSEYEIIPPDKDNF